MNLLNTSTNTIKIVKKCTLTKGQFSTTILFSINSAKINVILRIIAILF